MTTADAHQFFSASASVGGALIGLLFVAVSVAPERILGPNAEDVHGVRAAATLTAFVNALTVVLFGLVPGFNAGKAAMVVSIFGLLFISGALVRMVPAWRAKEVRLFDLSFLFALLTVFVVQLIVGIGLAHNGSDGDDLQIICVLVIVCFLIGIERAWGLVGGPSVRLTHEVLVRVKGRRESAQEDDSPESADG
jgi:hypothetical protein